MRRLFGTILILILLATAGSTLLNNSSPSKLKYLADPVLPGEEKQMFVIKG